MHADDGAIPACEQQLASNIQIDVDQLSHAGTSCLKDRSGTAEMV